MRPQLSPQDPIPSKGPPTPPEPSDGSAHSPAWETIAVQVDESYVTEVDAADLVRAVATTLLAEGHAGMEVSVVVTSDEVMESLNRQFRGIEGPTDVLSFPAQESAVVTEGTPHFVSAPEAANYLGDIIIAFPFTQRQAAELQRSLTDELRLLAVHGTLHLLGYDHAEPEEEAKMWARQDEVLAGLVGP